MRHESNRGYGAALRSCFLHAKQDGARTLIVLDGDGQHLPNFIPELLGPVVSGSTDICIGSRMLRRQSLRSVPQHRRIGIRLLTILANMKFRNNNRITDAQSGFRAYSRAAIDALSPQENDMGASIEILWQADRLGLRIAEVAVDVTYHERGTSGRHPIEQGLAVILSMLRQARRERRLEDVPRPYVMKGDATKGDSIQVRPRRPP